MSAFSEPVTASSSVTRTLRLPKVRGFGKKPRFDPSVAGVIAGWGAGTAEALTCHPFDTVKVGLQTLKKASPHQIQLQHSNSWFPRSKLFAVIGDIIGSRGPLGFYNGLAPVVLFMGPKIAIRFTSFETMKKSLAQPDGTLTTNNALLCGLSAGIVEALAVVTPMEAVKIKLQSSEMVNGQRKYRNIFQAVPLIVREGGFKALYNGLAMTAARQSTNQAAAFGTYSTLKTYLEKKQDGAPLTGWKVTLVGLCAGIAAPAANTPLDTVKTRLQRGSPIRGVSEFTRARMIFLDCLRNEGVAALYRGTTLRIMRAAPAQAVTFTAYENIRRYLTKP